VHVLESIGVGVISGADLPGVDLLGRGIEADVMQFWRIWEAKVATKSKSDEGDRDGSGRSKSHVTLR
jgi:hypothetical protein